MRAIGLWVLLSPFFLSLGATSSGFDPQQLFTSKKIKVIWVDVQGDSLSEVRQSLRERGPKDQFKNSFYGVTRWSIRWQLPHDEAGHMDLSGIATDADVTILLPRWKIDLDRNQKDLVSWSKMYRALLTHEVEHANRALDTACRIQKTIRDAVKRDPLFDPSNAQKIAFRLVEDNQKWDLHYDRMTLHGQNQGVVLDQL